MLVSSKLVLSEAETELLKTWLLLLLNNEQLTGPHPPLPLDNRLLIYVNSRPHVIVHGNWQFSSPFLYMPGRSEQIHYVDRIACIAAIAASGGLHHDVSVQNAILDGISNAVKNLTMIARNAFLESVNDVSRIAFSPDFTRAAAWIKDGWYTQAGEQVNDVDATWIIMDC